MCWELCRLNCSRRFCRLTAFSRWKVCPIYLLMTLLSFSILLFTLQLHCPAAPLAISERVCERLLRQARSFSRTLNSTMALVEVPPGLPPFDDQKPMVPPPAVVTTPCDAWPRPYFLENGLRRVAPYHYTYNTYCKERWRGRELLDIFASEFRDRPEAYYVGAILCVAARN